MRTLTIMERDTITGGMLPPGPGFGGGGGGATPPPNPLNAPGIATVRQLSSLFNNEINSALSHGWKIVYANGSTGGSVTDYGTKTIDIGTAYEGKGTTANQLAHELGHYEHTDHYDWSSESAYVAAQEFAEGEAVENLVEVAKQLDPNDSAAQYEFVNGDVAYEKSVLRIFNSMEADGKSFAEIAQALGKNLADQKLADGLTYKQQWEHDWKSDPQAHGGGSNSGGGTGLNPLPPIPVPPPLPPVPPPTGIVTVGPIGS